MIKNFHPCFFLRRERICANGHEFCSTDYGNIEATQKLDRPVSFFKNLFILIPDLIDRFCAVLRSSLNPKKSKGSGVRILYLYRIKDLFNNHVKNFV